MGEEAKVIYVIIGKGQGLILLIW